MTRSPSKDPHGVSADRLVRRQEEIRKKLRFLIATHHVPLADLAEALRVEPRAFREVVDGRAAPWPALLEAIAKYFRVTPDFLLADAKSSRPGRRAPAPRRRPPGRRRRADSPRSVTVRQQALVEILIKKGIFTAAEYRQQLQSVARRVTPPA